MTRSTDPSRPPGRPRTGIDSEVFAATLRTVDELGYARATVERIAAAAGVAKTTVYRRWPAKGDLIVDCLLHAFGSPPLEGDDRAEIMSGAIRWLVARLAEPGLGDAFAGVFSDAVSNPQLRESLRSRFQEPYLRLLQAAIGESEQRMLFYIDVTVGTLLHRMGISGEPMVPEDVQALIDMVVTYMDVGDGDAD